MLFYRSLVVLLAAQAVGFAYLFQDPPIPNNEFSAYLAFEKGKVVPIERTITVENDCYRTEHTDTTGLRVISIVDRQTLGTVKVEKFRHGKPTLTVNCDSAGITVRDLRNKKTRRFRHPGPVFDRHTLWEVFRGFPFREGKSVEFPLLVPELGVITAVVRFDRKETIDTDFGTIECCKLTMAPKGVVGWMYGKRFFFWYETGAPRRLVLYGDSDGRVTKLQQKY